MAQGKKDIPIISGEWGYSTAWQDVSAAKQGELLARSWLTNLANGIRVSVWYDWKDDGVDRRNPEHNFGTVANVYRGHADRPYDPKPAYLAASTLTRFFAGYSVAGRVPMNNADDYVLLFRNGVDIQVAAWTTSKDVRKVVIPLSAGLYEASEYSGNTVGAIRSTQNGLPISLRNAPLYIKKNHKEK